MMLWTVLALTGLASVARGADVLAMLPLPAFSHTNSYLPLLEELARRGHNVTVVSPFPRKKPLPNYRDIALPITDEDVMSGTNINLRDTNNFWFNVQGLWAFCPPYLDAILSLPILQDFITNDNSHFDLIITETWCCQEPFVALAHKYSAHLIAMHPLVMGSVEASYTGNSLPYSYLSHMKVVPDVEITFSQRALSTLYYVADLLTHKFLYFPKQEKYMQDFFKYPGWEKRPPLTELLLNHSLLMVDNHISLSSARPLLPNVVEFGPLSLKKAKPLPKDLEEYMSSAKDGVIFLSWGSHYKSTNMPPEMLSKFMSAFGKLKQRVLMKWEDPELPGKPDNVRTAPWFPQASILAHPNLKAFISHCGIHGLAEATVNGVPILGTPIFADQMMNSKVAVRAGFGIELDLDSFTEDILLQSLHKLINDPSYKKAAVRQSKIFSDRETSALDHAVYWVEYVLRHEGAVHLRPAGLRLPLYQYFLLDVLGLVLAVLAVWVFTVFLLIRILCRRTKSTDRKSKKE